MIAIHRVQIYIRAAVIVCHASKGAFKGSRFRVCHHSLQWNSRLAAPVAEAGIHQNRHGTLTHSQANFIEHFSILIYLSIQDKTGRP
jgi:hypothetical protein